MHLKPQILLIDHDDVFLKSTQDLLADLGDVFTTTDPVSVPKILTHQPIRLVVIDLWMKTMNGSAMLQFLRGTFPEVPVMLVTAYASRELAIEAANLHVFAILEKPIQKASFLETVKRALQRPAPFSAPTEVRLDPEALTASLDGIKIYLTHTEFTLLQALTERRGKRIPREDLMTLVWGESKVVANVFDTHLGNLKKKLPILKSRLRVIRGKGYVFS